MVSILPGKPSIGCFKPSGDGNAKPRAYELPNDENARC